MCLKGLTYDWFKSYDTKRQKNGQEWSYKGHLKRDIHFKTVFTYPHPWTSLVKYRRAINFLGNMCKLAVFCFSSNLHETIWWSLSLKNNIRKMYKIKLIDTKAETISFLSIFCHTILPLYSRTLSHCSIIFLKLQLVCKQSDWKMCRRSMFEIFLA